jgi:hypothetical protein
MYENTYTGCDVCIHYDKDECDEPCVYCKHGIPPNYPAYNTAKSYYTPKGEDDVVNHPNHYTDGGIECINEMLMVFGRRVVADFCLCNVWKYRRRALQKNGQEDMEKSHWYMVKYKEIMDEVRLYEDI